MSDEPNRDPYATSDEPPPPPIGACKATFYSDEDAGAMVGPYKLLQKLGKGGMGVVWMAEQREPVQRFVALKINKSDLRGSHVIARFEAERQALAMMDHPNIAKVLDAGTTAAGRPYFVMELVKGVPFTKYCDEEHLTPKERLELFMPVCHAVQHAHQKGVIHRDLKPSNVLIALYDGRPVPKVIDFGIAKAMHQKLTEKTLFTEVGQIVGTLEYMAPEQAELNNLDIDTRADIYSLGVMLYELLTGSRPFSSKQLRGDALLEMLRVIKEVEPPKPSTRLSSSEDLPIVAANRKLEPRSLSRLVKGDLDWIVMKCLEKDRARRYETANQLGAELARFLADEPVQAGPPSLGYRARKFLRRNKGGVIAAALVLLLLVAGIIGTSIGLAQAESARVAETRQREIAEANEKDAKVAAKKLDEQSKQLEQTAHRLRTVNERLKDIAWEVFTTQKLSLESIAVIADPQKKEYWNALDKACNQRCIDLLGVREPRIKNAMEDRNEWRDRAAWSKRMFEKGNVSKTQADSDQSKLVSAERLVSDMVASTKFWTTPFGRHLILEAWSPATEGFIRVLRGEPRIQLPLPAEREAPGLHLSLALAQHRLGNFSEASACLKCILLPADASPAITQLQREVAVELGINHKTD